MIISMTGFGKAELKLNNAIITIEVKSLNAKQIDANVKMSSVYKDKEIVLRNLLSEKLNRGKIDLSIWKEKSTSTANYIINKEIISNYQRQIEELRKELNYPTSLYTDMMQTMIQMPGVIEEGREIVDEQEWEEIAKGVDIAIKDLIQFRKDEGKKLEEDITAKINLITQLLKDLEPLAKTRIEKIKKQLSEKLNDLGTNNIDENRFEQELIYYLEKQDITEEEVRLAAHLEYFTDTMKTDTPNGKKLGFIAQEIGREINTIGSKASDANMQRIVVQMKDELEKVKEQLLNIL